MIHINEVVETNQMVLEHNLDVRTITMGISLLDCGSTDLKTFNQKIYDKITKSAENLVKVGEDISKEIGIPIVNKRISVTPVAIAAASTNADSYVSVAQALDKAAKEVGVIHRRFLGIGSERIHTQ